MIIPSTDFPQLLSTLLSNLKYLLNDQQPSSQLPSQPPSLSLNLHHCLQLSLKLMKQQQSTELLMINTYQSVTHLLDNLLLLQGIIKSNDKNLLSKALEHFHDHLITLVQNLHSHPISSCNRLKKNNFMQRHLEIMNDFDFKTKSKNSKEDANTNKQFSFSSESKISQIQYARAGEESYYESPDYLQVVGQLEEAKLIIEDLNRCYDEEVQRLVEGNNEMEKHFEEEKLKFINIIEELEVETVRLKYEKLRDQIMIDELRGELKQMTFKSHQKQLSTGQFDYSQ